MARTRPAVVPNRDSRAALAGRRLLVIEDEPLIALEIGAYLDNAGVDLARHAGGEEEALQAIEQIDFDAALLDANLHGRPVDRIAAALTRRGTPFIFVTGYGRSGLPESFRQAPILAKPFSEQELIAAVAGVAGQTGRPGELAGPNQRLRS